MRFIYFLWILALLSSCAGSSYKHAYIKQNRNYYKYRYSASLKNPMMACKVVERNKRKKKTNNVKNGNNEWKEERYYGLAETDVPLTSAKPAPKLAPKPIEKPKADDDFHHKSFSEQTIEERRQIEDEVLEKNNLPRPTSAQHEKIRKSVEKKLTGHKDGDPINLEPLYFTFDEAEFAVVDMEPFLIAVEYALQGRMILIEGHTDSRGQDNYNVKLSIQRVEKIRQLMHDMGVPDERISIVGYGEEIAVHNNETEQGRQKNRRVDFTVF